MRGIVAEIRIHLEKDVVGALQSPAKSRYVSSAETEFSAPVQHMHTRLPGGNLVGKGSGAVRRPVIDYQHFQAVVLRQHLRDQARKVVALVVGGNNDEGVLQAGGCLYAGFGHGMLSKTAKITRMWLDGQVKVLYLVSAYSRNSSDIITPWLTETIHRLRGRSVDVEVLAPAYRGLRTQVVDAVRVHRFRYAPRRWETLTHDQTAPDRIRERPVLLGLVPSYVLSGSIAAARLARTGEFSAIHAFWPLPHGLIGLAAKRTSGLPLVSTFFGVELTWMERDLPFLGPVLRRIVRGSDTVTAISTYTADRLKRQVPGADPVIIPFGATVEPQADLPDARTDPEAPFELLFVGRLVERKGVHLLLDALAALSPEGRFVLRIVGDGPERPRLEAQAERLRLGSRVVFHGFVTREELEARMEACDCVVLPAVVDAKGDTEGLGVVLLEAMTYGKPVVASKAGGILDIVRDGRNGFLVSPGDAEALAGAIRALAHDPERAARLGAQAREDVTAGFAWPVIIDRLEGVYRTLGASAPDVRHSFPRP